jgi:hypothetical protein
MLFLPAVAWGAETFPVLSVPPSQAMLHVAVSLPKGPALLASSVGRLVEIGGPAEPIPAQGIPIISADGSGIHPTNLLVADIPPQRGAAAPRRFRLEVATTGEKSRFRFVDVDDKSIKLLDGGKPVLVYNYGTITGGKVPAKDARRNRACYIHPLWGLGGEVLTDDFPADHYHHHGIFWAWPHVGIDRVGTGGVGTDGKEYDLWMYSNITQRFVRWLDRETGPVAAVLGVENGWFVGEKKVMIERVWLRVYRATSNTLVLTGSSGWTGTLPDQRERSLDLEFAWIPTDRPITLRGAEGKSYGGLCVRFAVGNPKDAVITVPGGPAKEDLPETPLPWADQTARFAGSTGPSGAAIFVPQLHPDYPPTWLTRHYGPLCVGWPGVRGKTFEPGQPIRLSYRLWIHPAAVDLEQLKEAYAAYLSAAAVRWEP